jgi:hypothetical protein
MGTYPTTVSDGTAQDREAGNDDELTRWRLLDATPSKACVQSVALSGQAYTKAVLANGGAFVDRGIGLVDQEQALLNIIAKASQSSSP